MAIGSNALSGLTQAGGIGFVGGMFIDAAEQNQKPTGNIYNEHMFSSEPLFPGYMENVHKHWLGFVPPSESSLPPPNVKIENFDVQPYVGMEYVIHTYDDNGVEIPIEVGMKHHRSVLYPRGFDIEYHWTDPIELHNENSWISQRANTRIITGATVTEVYSCTYEQSIMFRVWELVPFMNWYKTRSVTQTMNSVLDVFVEEIDRLGVVKDQFRSMVDIRNMEATLAQG